MPETIISSGGLDVKLLQPGTEHLQASYILNFTKQIANETCYHCVGCQLLCPCLTALQAHLISSWELHRGCSIIYEALRMKKPTEALVQKPFTAPWPPVWLSYFSMTSHGFSNTKKGDGKEKKCLPRKRGREDHRSTTAQSLLGPTKFWRGEERQSGPASKRGREEFRSPSPQAGLSKPWVGKSPQPGPSWKIARSSLQDLSTLSKTTKRLREEEETDKAVIS
ncbi:uncharacterized protein LOC134027076 [Osmerus eperlanus]|uniref:uncharacterized protein LOC134027076 n=1 Tax=Osmerus eperlanus TaxID=29151 RepID=UPI002E0F040A